MELQQNTVEQLSELIQTRNILIARRAPLRCISNVNGEICLKAAEAKNRVTDFALQYVMELAGDRYTLK